MEEPNWKKLSADPSPEAIELLSKNRSQINWRIAAHNPSALPLLQANLDKIGYYLYEPDLSDAVVYLILKNRNMLSYISNEKFKTPRLKEFFDYEQQVDNKFNDLRKIINSIDNEYQLIKINDAIQDIDNLICDALK